MSSTDILRVKCEIHSNLSLKTRNNLQYHEIEKMCELVGPHNRMHMVYNHKVSSGGTSLPTMVKTVAVSANLQLQPKYSTYFLVFPEAYFSGKSELRKAGSVAPPCKTALSHFLMQRRCPLEQVTSRKKAWQSVNHTNWRVCMTLCYEAIAPVSPPLETLFYLDG
jgi:hypothetical protein